jgi:hypothetical protein
MARFTSLTARLAFAFGLATLGAIAAYAIFGSPRIGIDDANIIFVYARNLAAGAGLVFTPGYERVEGFSTPVWMLVSSLAFGLTPWPERILAILSVALSGLALAAVLAIVQLLYGRGAGGAGEEGPPPGLAQLLALAWFPMIPAYYAWTTGTLMESALWAALLHGAAWVLVLDATGRCGERAAVVRLGALAAGLALTRPEGLALGPFLILLAVIAAAPRVGGLGPALRRVAPAALGLAATMAGLTLFRLLYFGQPLPNTYYAKVSPDRLYTALDGARYLLEFWKAEPPAFVLSLVALAQALRCGRRLASRRRAGGAPPEPRDAAVFAVSCLVLAGLALPLAEGGDYFGAHRFFQPFVPLMILPLIDLLRGGGRRAARARAWPGPAWLAALALATMALTAWAWLDFSDETALAREYRLAEKGRRLGSALNLAFPAEARPRLAAIATGGLGFGYEGRVLDLVGLNWTAMARAPGQRKGTRSHSAFHPEVFWRELPEVVTPNLLMFEPRFACDIHDPFADRVLHRLFATRRFRERYAAGYLRTSLGVVSGYFLRSWLPGAQPAGLLLFSAADAYCGPTQDG